MTNILADATRDTYRREYFRVCQNQVVAETLATVRLAIAGAIPVNSLGAFERALYQNNLLDAFLQADIQNRVILFQYVSVMAQRFPHKWYERIQR